MNLFVEKTATDQLVSALFFLAAGALIVPYMASGMMWVVEKMNGFAEPWTEWQARGFVIGRYFFAIAAMVFAGLGAARLAFYVAVKSGLIQTPWAVTS